MLSSDGQRRFARVAGCEAGINQREMDGNERKLKRESRRLCCRSSRAGRKEAFPNPAVMAVPDECRKSLGNQRDTGILFAFGGVYQLCPAGHHMEWNLLDASSHAAPLGG